MCNMEEKRWINKYEKLYFERIKKIIEENGTTIFRNLTTKYNFNNFESNYGGLSEIANGMERVIQSIISEQTDWEIFSLPDSSDSSFITPKCVIQIDCKSTLESDQDSIGHKITVGKNQISYASENHQIVYKDVPFRSNIPFIYHHNIYGSLGATTYFVKMHYDISNGISSFRNFHLYLACVPNGMLQDIYGTDFIEAGRKITTEPYDSMDIELYDSLIAELTDNEINIIDSTYDLDTETNIRRLKAFMYLNTNSLPEEEKELKTSLKNIFKAHKFNRERISLRISLQDMSLQESNPNSGTEFDWDRYVELDLT
ncbi:hypothetical protein ONV75_01685 [Clostridium sp. LQ25]|uniref:hypothetical protein n=1 Tax=Clostridium sp. LQ25 TaxID=2992805 RepID=UPI00225A3259|nr:hypothetical protein [Clostridium sp. LQ25]UZT06629.1 hypothetical protein ONV75_01685 [Clostridium sp. LQ25]